MSNVKRITCKGCNQRRVPFLGSRGRPTKYCKQCKSGSFWTSSFGFWFLDAAVRQSPDSMPFNEEDIKAIYELWKRRRAAQGSRYEVETVWDYGKDFSSPWSLIKQGCWKKDYDYHLSHLDPVKGEGFQGRLTAKNLVIAPASVNQSLGNAQTVDHGYRVYSNTPTFNNDQEVRVWCTNKYDIAKIADELKLKPKSKVTPKDDLRLGNEALAPNELLIQEMIRLGANWTANHVVDAFDAFKEFLRLGIQGASHIEARYGKLIDWDAIYAEF